MKAGFQSEATSIRFRIEPRDVPAVKAARRLHLTLAEFQRYLPKLSDRGFPSPDPTTGHFDLVAIDEWLDRRSGLRKGLANPDRPDDASLGFEDRLRALRDQGRRR